MFTASTENIFSFAKKSIVVKPTSSSKKSEEDQLGWFYVLNE